MENNTRMAPDKKNHLKRWFFLYERGGAFNPLIHNVSYLEKGIFPIIYMIKFMKNYQCH